MFRDCCDSGGGSHRSSRTAVPGTVAPSPGTVDRPAIQVQ